MTKNELINAARQVMPHCGDESIHFSVEGISFDGRSDYSDRYRLYVWADELKYGDVRIDIYPYENEVEIRHPFPEAGIVYTLPFLEGVEEYYPLKKWDRRAKQLVIEK